VGHLEVSVPIEVREGIRQQRYNEERARDFGRGIQATDLNENGNPEPIKTVNGTGKQKESMLLYEKGSDEPLERMLLAGETIPDQTWYACAIVKDSEFASSVLNLTLLTCGLTRRGPSHSSNQDFTNATSFVISRSIGFYGQRERAEREESCRRGRFR
jgi:hypothetical protein